jgi:MFS family permease
MTPAAPPTSAAVAASMFIGTAAFMVLGIQPVLLGALVEAHRLTEQWLGIVATAEVLALAFGAIVGPPLMKRGGMRGKTLAVAGLLTIANLASFVAHTPLQIAIVRTFAGCAEGLLLSAAIYVLTHTRHPERVSGLFLALSTIPQVFAAYLLPVSLIPHYGANIGFALLTALAAAVAPAALALPRAPLISHASEADDLSLAALSQIGVVGLGAVIALFAVVIENIAIGSSWSYLEGVANQSHLSSQVLGVAVAAVLVFQVAGSLLVAWVGWKVDHRLALIGGSALLGVSALLLTAAHSPAAFIATCCLFGMLWLGLAPFHVKLAIGLDPSRRIAMIVMPLALVGLSVGPMIGAALVVGNDVSRVYAMSAIAAVAAAALFGLATLVARHLAPVTPALAVEGALGGRAGPANGPD